ncbi:hypothetical protein FJY93_01735 [Candidatus Kaiserbacteria bacterium]|nr:hypothetical protein [Candidatus Kaiserbacteria bacterium]
MLDDAYKKTAGLASADDYTALKWQDEIADMRGRQRIIEAKVRETREIAGIPAPEQVWGSRPGITLLTPREIEKISDESIRSRVIGLYKDIMDELDREEPSVDVSQVETLRKTQLLVTGMLEDMGKKRDLIKTTDEHTVLKLQDELADMGERQKVIETKAKEAREIAGIPAPEQAWGSRPGITLLTPREIGNIADESTRNRVLALYRDIGDELNRA